MRKVIILTLLAGVSALAQVGGGGCGVDSTGRVFCASRWSDNGAFLFPDAATLPIRLKDRSTPGSNPASGYSYVYSKSGAVCSLSSGGTETCTGGSGGGGTPGGTDGQFQYNSSGSFAGGTLANCVSTGGVLQYTSATHTFSCHTLVSGDIPTLNQNTTGTAANLSGTPALPNGTTATTQSQADGSTKIATTAYVDTLGATKAASNATTTVNGTSCALGSTCTITTDSTPPVVATITAPSTCSSSGGTGTNSCTLTSGTTLAVTHNLTTTRPWVSCFDGSGNMLGSTGASTSVTSVVATSSSVATITFSGSTSGSCSISSGSMGPQGATGATGATGPQGPAGSGSGDVTAAGTNSFTGANTVGTGGSFVSSGTGTIDANKLKGVSVDAPTTKGDVYCYDGSALKRLGVGSNNQILTADSAASCGVKWGAAPTTASYSLPLRFYFATIPSSTSTHYFMGWNATGTNNAGTGNGLSWSVQVPISGTIVKAYWEMYNGAAATGSGDASIALCINGGTSATCNGTAVSVSSSITIPVQFAQIRGSSGTLSQAVTAGDKILIDYVPGTTSASSTIAILLHLVIAQ